MILPRQSAHSVTVTQVRLHHPVHHASCNPNRDAEPADCKQTAHISLEGSPWVTSPSRSRAADRRTDLGRSPRELALRHGHASSVPPRWCRERTAPAGNTIHQNVLRMVRNRGKPFCSHGLGPGKARRCRSLAQEHANARPPFRPALAAAMAAL